MFAKDKVTQSMLDAVNSVISEAETKEPTKKKPSWLIDAEKAAEAREGKLKEDSKPTGKKPDWLLAAELKAEKKAGKLKESEKLDEIDADAILKMAKKITPNAKMRGSVEDQKKERDAMIAKRGDKPLKTPYQPEPTFGDSKGYGQGRYMGDSVEVNDELVEAENVTTGKVKKIADKEALKIADKEVGKHEKSMHDKQSDLIKKESDQRFIDAVSKVINGARNITVEEETLNEKNWIKGAIKHPGAMTAAAKREGESTSEYEEKHKHDSGKAGKRARLALTLKKMHHEEVEGVEEAMRPGFDYQAAAKEAQQRKAAGYERSGPYSWKKIKTEKPEEKKTQKEEVEQMYEDERDPTDDVVKKILKNREKYAKRNVTGESDPTDIAVSQILKNREKNAKSKKKTQKEEVEQIDEAMTKKHFQQVADVIKAHPDEKKRHELAIHHAGIFKASNPRFDHTKFMKACGAPIKEDVEQMDEVENAFTAYKNKRPSELGRHLTRTHDAKRLSDTSVMYTKKHGKDLESAKDAGDAHNASVYAKQKMKKEEFDELAIEARDWEKRDKDGKVTSWGHEGDWKPVSKNKEGSGKASNNAGKALQKTKELAKEDTKEYGFDDEQPKKMTTDTLAGRVKVSKKFDNQHTSRKVELKAEEAHPDAAEDKKLISKMIKKDDEREEKKDEKKDAKLIKKLMKKEETEFEHIHGEHLKVHSGPHKGKAGTLHDIHGHIFEIKPHGAKSEKEHIYVPQNHTTIIHQHDEEYIPESFHGPEAGSGTGDSPMATNDSKPVKLAKYLAVKTANKMKNEMLGKMTN